MRPNLLKWLLFIVLALIWGSSFLLMKRSLHYFSFYEIGALRIIIAGLVLLPFAFRKLKKIKKKELFFLLLVGFVGNTMPAFLFTKAQTGIDSALAGILNSLTPLFTLIVGLLFFQLKTKCINVLGVFIALIGSLVLLTINGGHNFDYNISYAIYIIIAVCCYSFNLNIVKYKLQNIDVVSITSIAFALMLIPLILYLFTSTDFLHQIQTEEESRYGLIYVGSLAVFCSALALLLFNWLIKISGVMLSSSITYLIPVVAIFWGISDGESFGLIDAISVLVILFGIVLVNYKKRKSKSAHS